MALESMNMKYMVVLLIFISFKAGGQIWKEPFDTLPYLDNFERLSGNKIGIRSYSVTQFDDHDSILAYNFYGFDRNGYLTDELYAMYPGQHLDTNHYCYLNGIIQGSDFKREHLYNEQHRLIEIRNSKVDSVWSTNYYYENNRLIRISYSKQNWTTFQYDSLGKLYRKDIFRGGHLKEYFNYWHPGTYRLIYQNCVLSREGEVYVPCEVTEGYFDRNNKLIKIVLKHEIDSSNVFIIHFKYNKQGLLTSMTDKVLHDPEQESEIRYIRNRKGVLIRMEYFRKQKRYMYSEFDYLYY